jgi:hypothetical protein
VLYQYGTGSKPEQDSASLSSPGSINDQHHHTKGPIRQRTGPFYLLISCQKAGFNAPGRAE